MDAFNEEHNNLPWTGERMVPEIFNFGAIEHLHRYAVAQKYVKDKTILDIASGEGYGSMLLALHAKKVKGVDVSTEAVNHAKKKYQRENLEFMIGSADHIPIEDGTIDVVVSFETIEHHDKHVEMMKEIKRVLKKDGILIISSPDKKNYTEVMGFKIDYHIKELYQEEFESLISDFFKFRRMLFQRTVYGSLIAPVDENSGFAEYAGNYQIINEYDKIQVPWFNICIASDYPVDLSKVSYFDGYKLLREISTDAQMRIKQTYDYRIGRLILSPFRVLINFFRAR